MTNNPFANVATISEFLAVWLKHDLLASEPQAYVDDYYRQWATLNSPRLGYWYNHQVRDMEAFLRAQERPKVLEAGVGSGTESLWFAWLGGDVLGIDSMPHCVEVSRARLDALQRVTDRRLSCRFEQRSVLDLESEDEFDLIWLEQAFHHMEPRDDVVRRLARALKPGGHIVFSEANAFNPLLQALLIKQRGFKRIIQINTADGPALWGNERVISAPALARLLRGAKLEPRSTRYFRALPSNKWFERLFGAEKLLTSLSAIPLFWPAFTHYNFVAQKSA